MRGDAPAGPARDSERSRIRRLFGNAGVYTIGTLSLQALSAVLAPILTQLIAPHEYGVWTLASMCIAGLSQIYNPALHGAVTRYYFEHEHDEARRREFRGTVVTFLLGWGLTLSVVLTALGPRIFAALFEGMPFDPYGSFVVWITFGSVLGVVPKAAWAAAEQSGRFVGAHLLASAVNLVGAIALVAFTPLGVLGLFWARALSVAVVAIPYLVFTVRHAGLTWSTPVIRDALRFSLPLVPHLLAHWVLGMSDRMLIEHFIDLRAVGIFGVAYTFIDLVNTIANSMNLAWVPQFTRSYADDDQRPFVARGITYFALAVAAAGTASVVLSSSLIRTVFDSRYAEAAQIAPILGFGGVFQGLYYVWVAGLFYSKKTGVIPVITFASAALNVLLNLWWIPRYGLVGAAWATVAGYAVLLLGVWVACNRAAKLPLEAGRLWRIAIVASATCAVSVAIDGRVAPWPELALKVGVLLGGGVALWLSGFVTSEDRDRLRGRLARVLRR